MAHKKQTVAAAASRPRLVSTFPRDHRRRQPTLGPGSFRHALPAAVEAHLWRWVDQQAYRFRCSRAMVVATALSDVSGKPLQGRYRYDYREKE